MRSAQASEAGAQHLLGSGLAGAAGDGDDAGVRGKAHTGGAADAGQRFERVGGAEQGAVIPMPLIALRHQRRGGACLERTGDELVAVAAVLERHEQIARL